MAVSESNAGGVGAAVGGVSGVNGSKPSGGMAFEGDGGTTSKGTGSGGTSSGIVGSGGVVSSGTRLDGDGGTPSNETGNGGSVWGGAGIGGSSASNSPACARSVSLQNGRPLVADFDGYDGVATLSSWSFALGNDVTLGVYAGPYARGDEGSNLPDSFDMVTGHDTKYAMRIMDVRAKYLGGAAGIWVSGCIDASAFMGLSFWARGTAPTGIVQLSVAVPGTIPSFPQVSSVVKGTCPGTTTTCVHPSYRFRLIDTWTEFRVLWSAFVPGDAAGTPVKLDGRDIVQLEFKLDLLYSSTNGTREPVPAAYEFVVDTVLFY